MFHSSRPPRPPRPPRVGDAMTRRVGGRASALVVLARLAGGARRHSAASARLAHHRAFAPPSSHSVRASVRPSVRPIGLGGAVR